MSSPVRFHIRTRKFFSMRIAGRPLVLILFSAFLLPACKTTRKVVDIPVATVKLKGANVIQVFDSVLHHEFRFNYLTAKASVDYTDKTGETMSFDINMRVAHDSAIWISLTPLLGIEAVRVLINRDSLFIMDRVNKYYMKRGYDYLEELLKTNVTYEMIEAVVAGNYFPYIRSEKLRSLYEDEPYVILSTLNKRQARRASEEKDPTKPVIQDFWIDGNYRIAKSRITDDKRDRWVEASYKNFSDINGYLFPNELVVTISANSPTIIRVSYSKVAPEANSLSMPFTIPEKYEGR